MTLKSVWSRFCRQIVSVCSAEKIPFTLHFIEYNDLGLTMFILFNTNKWICWFRYRKTPPVQVKVVSFVSANVLDGVRPAETLCEDMFIRKFLAGTWHKLFLSEIIIKRQHNLIRIAGIVLRSLPPRKLYFLIGYTEEILSYWLQCPVKLELQTTPNRSDVTFKYI